MPRVGMRIPAHLIELIDEVAEREEKSREELYAVAITAYLRGNERREAPEQRGATRKAWEGQKMPRIAVDLSEEHIKRAGKLAKRFDKPREMLIAEAVAEYVHRDKKPAQSTTEGGHEVAPEVPRGTSHA